MRNRAGGSRFAACFENDTTKLELTSTLARAATPVGPDGDVLIAGASLLVALPLMGILLGQALVDGYVVEGHVPIAPLLRMLRERPDIKGISLPGMPAGSPGMSGEKTAPFTIYEIGDEPKVYAVE